MKKGFKLFPLLAMGIFVLSSCGAKGFYETNFSDVKQLLYYPGMKEDVINPNHAYQHASPKEMDQMIAKYENEDGFKRFYIDEPFSELSYCFNCGNSYAGNSLAGTPCNKCSDIYKVVDAYFETIYLNDDIIFRIYIPII